MSGEATVYKAVAEGQLSLEEGTACKIIEGAVMGSAMPMSRSLLILRRAAESMYAKHATKLTVVIRSPSVEDDVAAAYELAKLNSVGVEDDLHNAEGGGVSSAEFARELGISNETVRSYLKANRLIAWRKDLKNLRFPAWQIHNGSILAGLEEVLECAKRKEWTTEDIISFFLTPRDMLKGQRPLDLLRNGDAEPVLRAARQEGDIGA
jgi:hypothetical protein